MGAEHDYDKFIDRLATEKTTECKSCKRKYFDEDLLKLKVFSACTKMEGTTIRETLQMTCECGHMITIERTGFRGKAIFK